MVEKTKNNRVLTCICVAAITVITFFVFSPSLNDRFTNWDDPDYVLDNPLVVNNSVSLVKIFETPVSVNYHPLTVLSLAVNYQIDRFNPFGYHLVNLIFHLLNTILVFVFIYLLARRNLLIASIVSLFFGIHPMHVESVTWISERKDVLYVFFFLSGLITYIRYSETKKRSWYIFTLLLYLLSCLSKAMAVVFPVILLLIDYLNGIKWERKLLTEKIPFFILSIVFGIIAVKTQQLNHTSFETKGFTFFHRLLFASYGFVIYIVKLFIPYKLSAFYPYPDIKAGIPFIFYLSPFILAIIILSLIYLFRKKEKEIVFGLLFYFVSVVFVLQFVSVGRVVIADRYSYLSYIGLLFAAAYIINKAWQSRSGLMSSLKYAVTIIAGIAAIIYSCQTYARAQVWKNGETLWTDVIDNYPDADIAYNNRGNYHHEHNEMEKALNDYNTGLRIDSSYGDDYYNRAILYSSYYKKDILAIADYTKAISLDPTYAKAYNNRGVLLSKYGKNDLALADYTKAIALDSTFADAYNNRGLLYLNTGKTALAIADFTKDININPAFAKAYCNLGLYYLRTGKFDSAIAEYYKAIEIDSTLDYAYSKLGLLYLKTGNNDLAIANLNKALQLNPGDTDAYYNRGLIYSHTNKPALAINDYTKAIELNPAYTEAYNNRGLLYLNNSEPDLAIADFKKAITLNPTGADAYTNLGLIYFRHGKIDSALVYFTKSISLNPASAPCYFDRGLCYKMTNQYKKAVDDFTKAIELNPSVADFWLNRSLAESKIGQNENAKADELKAQQLQGK